MARGVSPNTLRRHFDKFLDRVPEAVGPNKGKLPLEIYIKADGKYFGHWGCIVVFKERGNIIYWDFVLRENYFNYLLSFSKIKDLGYKVLGLTSDWHSSLVASFKTAFPDLPHQRCLVHTQRECEALLTKNPETEAGRDLLQIVKLLNAIKNINERDIWILWLTRFGKRYEAVLKERTYSEDKTHWQYTHRKLRKTYRMLDGSLDHLFLYLENENIEKDTNSLEAEFKHLKKKLAVHNGLKRSRRINFNKWYFYLKSHDTKS